MRYYKKIFAREAVMYRQGENIEEVRLFAATRIHYDIELNMYYVDDLNNIKVYLKDTDFIIRHSEYKFEVMDQDKFHEEYGVLSE